MQLFPPPSTSGILPNLPNAHFAPFEVSMFPCLLAWGVHLGSVAFLLVAVVATTMYSVVGIMCPFLHIPKSPFLVFRPRPSQAMFGLPTTVPTPPRQSRILTPSPPTHLWLPGSCCVRSTVCVHTLPTVWHCQPRHSLPVLDVFDCH